MAADFWASTHYKHWLKSKSALHASQSKDAEYYSPQQLWQLHLFFIEHIHHIGMKLKLRQRVVATACVYFKRFYFKTNFCDFDPSLLAPTVILLACKVEECSKNARDIIKAIQVIERALYREMNENNEMIQLEIKVCPYDISDITQCEFALTQVLDYQLVLYTYLPTYLPTS